MYKDKKLLILGGSEFQIPLIMKAKELGIITYVIDINSNSPANSYADYFYQSSVKDKQAVLNIAEEINPDGITVGMVDVAVPTCAYVANKLKLSGISEESALFATNKYEMIKQFDKDGVPCPKFQYLSNNDLDTFDKPKIDFPIIVKPIDMAGSRGIFLVNDKEELHHALKESSKISDTGNLILEEYITGPEVSVELVIKNGEPNVIQITDKSTTGAPHFAETGHLQPSRLSESVKEEIRKVACSAAKSLGLINSIGHAEIKVTESGPKMIEIGARAGGDAIGEQLILLSTGVDFSKILIDIAFGYDILIPKKKNKASCIRFIQSRNGILKKFSGVEEAKQIKNVYAVKFTGEIGKEYYDVVDNSGRLGYVIAFGDTPDEALESCENAINCIKIEFEVGDN